MNFFKNVATFHKDVFTKIAINKSIFLIIAVIFLFGDFFKYLEPLLASGFLTEDSTALYFLKWPLYGFVLLSYIIKPCIYSLYFYRKDKTISKPRAFFKPVLNMRMYGIYIFLLISMLMAFSLSLKFVDDLSSVVMDEGKVLLDPQATNAEKEAIFNTSNKFIEAFNSTSGFEMILSISTFAILLSLIYFAFVFSIPLVVKSKKYGFFKSMKISFLAVFKNFGTFLFTIILVQFIGLLIPAFLSTYISADIINNLIDWNIHYLARPINALYDSLILFYIIIGLEKFILTKEKNDV